MIDPTQIESTHWDSKTKILTIYFYPRPGNPYYYDYKLSKVAGDKPLSVWRTLRGRVIEDNDTILLLNRLVLLKRHKAAKNKKNIIDSDLPDIKLEVKWTENKSKSWWGGWVQLFSSKH